MSEPVQFPRRYVNGRIYRSYEERVERGWVSCIAKRSYPRPASARAIIAETARRHGLTEAKLTGPSRVRNIVLARWDCMAQLRAYRGYSYSLCHIAALLGLKDHSSVLNGLQRWAEINREAA